MTSRPSVLPWPRRAAARVLASARGVAYWQLSLTREARRIGELRRFAEWIRGLTAPPPSLLAEEPLGTLAVALERPAASADSARRRAARQTNDNVGAGPARARRGGVAGGRSRTKASLLVPDRRAAEARATTVQPRAARLRRPLPSQDGRTRGRRGGTTAGAAVVQAQRLPALGEVLVDRAVRRLVAAMPAEVHDLVGSPAPAGERQRQTAATLVFPLDNTKAALIAQWAAAVTGRTAPRDLLWRLSESRRDTVDTPQADSRQPAAGASPPASPATSKHRNPRTESGLHDVSAPELPSPDGGVGPRTRTVAPEVPLPPLARTPSDGGPDPLGALAVDVPAGDLEPRTEAAARLRLTSTEAVSHGDELAALAGKVKRILDGEARRHGIDV
jgi:hypothetical protein